MRHHPKLSITLAPFNISSEAPHKCATAIHLPPKPSCTARCSPNSVKQLKQTLKSRHYQRKPTDDANKRYAFPVLLFTHRCYVAFLLVKVSFSSLRIPWIMGRRVPGVPCMSASKIPARWVASWGESRHLARQSQAEAVIQSCVITPPTSWLDNILTRTHVHASRTHTDRHSHAHTHTHTHTVSVFSNDSG